MQKVVHVSLNGNAYVLEEEGYAALERYLADAGRQLAGDPDRAEIQADLEQAIADKCARQLGPHKTVVTAAELERALEEMGPVGGPDAAAPSGAGPDATAAQAGATREPPASADARDAPRRLYRVLESGVLGGLCSGLGAYFRVDANVVRAVFVILALVTHGAWLLVYLVLLFVVPPAGTAEERAAAHGLPFSAQELIDEAKRQYARVEHGLRRPFARSRARRARRAAAWRGSWYAAPSTPAPAGPAPTPVTYAGQVAAGVVVPILAMISAGLTVAWLVASAMLVETGAIFGWAPGLPLWGALVAVVVAVAIVGGPIRHARHAIHRDAWQRGGLLAAWDGLVWLGFLALFAWAAWHFSPDVRAVVNDLPGAVERVRASLQHTGV